MTQLQEIPPQVNQSIFLMNTPQLKHSAIYIAIIVLIAAYNIDSLENPNNQLLIDTIESFTHIPANARQRAIQFVEHLPITVESPTDLLQYAMYNRRA